MTDDDQLENNTDAHDGSKERPVPWQSNSVIVGLLAGVIVGGAVLAGVAARWGSTAPGHSG